MKFKRNLLIFAVILIGILIVATGCVPTTVEEEVEEEAADAPTNGTISVAGGATTNDTTPTLTLSSTGATYMAFSGDGVNWSDWVAYATTYSSFGVTTGEGCTSGDGTKTVYVKYKNDDDVESTKVYDSFYLDTTAPTLSSAAYTDTGSGGTVNAGDTVVFTFNDEMLTTTVTASTVATVLPLSSGTTTVNPTAAVTDSAGNSDATTTAVTITGSSTTTITTAAILGVTAPVTGATPVTTITAATQYTGTVTWSPTATTFAASTAYTATITLTPTTGYTLTGVAANLFTVSGATSDTNSANSGVVTAVFPSTASPVKSMAWSATTFTEPVANDGTVTTVVTVMLTNETFVISGGVMTLGTHYTVANVPAGLTAVVTGTSTTCNHCLHRHRNCTCSSR